MNLFFTCTDNVKHMVADYIISLEDPIIFSTLPPPEVHLGGHANWFYHTFLDLDSGGPPMVFRNLFAYF